MNLTTVTGILASVFTACSLIPQLVKLLRDKEADNISFGMLGILFVGLVFWVWYGILKEDLIIILSNGFSLVVNLLIMIIAHRFKNKFSR